MSLGTGAIKGWWGPCANTRLSREVPWQPCERAPALQAATNQHWHTEGPSVEKLTWPDTNREPLLMRGGKGWALNWKNRRAKQWSTELNWASKLQIRWPKQWSIQTSNTQSSTQETTAIMAATADVQARGKASPCNHPTDHRDRCTHWLKISLA